MGFLLLDAQEEALGHELVGGGRVGDVQIRGGLLHLHHTLKQLLSQRVYRSRQTRPGGVFGPINKKNSYSKIIQFMDLCYTAFENALSHSC